MEVKREINRSNEQVPTARIDLALRISTSAEIECGYQTLEDVQLEGNRCLRCPKRPCNIACPVSNDIPEFIAAAESGDLKLAYQILRNKSTMPDVCSRVCPQEKQCEGSCTRGIKGEPVNIGKIERFIADYAIENGLTADAVFNDVDLSEQTVQKRVAGKKVAVVGSGPAGISAANVLARAGVDVTVFEKRHYFGGVLSYGIPKFRLPRNVVAKLHDELIQNGAKIELNAQVESMKSLADQFDAVFIGNGADIPKRANLTGEEAGQQNGRVHQALDLLEEVNLAKTDQENNLHQKFAEQDVVIIGGGNVAMDVAGVATRAAAKTVTVVYRRSLEELPARMEEVEMNREEGVQFKLLSMPREILLDDNGGARALLAQEVELGEVDESGRRIPVCKVGSEFEIPADVIILAIGSDQDDAAFSGALEVDAKKCIVVDEQLKTSHPKIWAGGDTVTGPLTVVSAVNAGQTAALSILQAL
jgi:glutamate synthase (NADPH/NADH) small chain